jgi:acetyl-CoA carboxylase carboxyl transferase subunit beta
LRNPQPFIMTKDNSSPVPPAAPRKKKREMPEGLWIKCPQCGEILFHKEIVTHLRTCPHCSFHMHISAPERILATCDPDSFQEFDTTMRPVDVLKFTAQSGYAAKMERSRLQTGLNDSVVSGEGRIEGLECVLAVMDFRFAGGSRGSVAGEKITRAVEHGAAARRPVVVFSSSGGARMQEGLFSLMQMAKTSGALARLRKVGVPYISVMTNPTTGGVTASFATLGDLILAEPRAMIGFAGPRVIKETTHQELPPGFQTAEFLRDRGLIDLIVHRKQMRATLARVLRYLTV